MSQKITKTRQVYFTAPELAQVDNILSGREFSRWVREKLAEEAAKQGKRFDNDLPQLFVDAVAKF